MTSTFCEQCGYVFGTVDRDPSGAEDAEPLPCPECGHVTKPRPGGGPSRLDRAREETRRLEGGGAEAQPG